MGILNSFKKGASEAWKNAGPKSPEQERTELILKAKEATERGDLETAQKILDLLDKTKR
jgi:hypothetical protein